MKKILSMVAILALVFTPAVFAADFDESQNVRVFDGTNFFGEAGTDPLYTTVVDAAGDQITVDGSGNLNVNIASGAISGTEFNEDTAHTTGDAGSQILAVRNDTLASLVDTDGDYAPIQVDASGAVYTSVSNVVSVDDNAGSLTVDGTVTANLSATDNAVLDQIELNTDYGTVVGGGTEATALRVTVANDSTGVLSVDDNGASLTVDATDLDIRDLTSVSDSVEVLQDTHDDLNANANLQVGNTDVSATNSVPVTQGNPVVSSDEIHDYNTAAAIAKNATSTHTYTTVGTTFFLDRVLCSGSGAVKCEVQVDGSTIAVGF